MSYARYVSYYVVANGGQKFGPADLPLLNQWIGEGRVVPGSILEDATTHAQIAASNVPGLNFPNAKPTSVYAAIPPSVPTGTVGVNQPYQASFSQQNPYRADRGERDVTNAWVCAGLGLAAFMVPCCAGFGQLIAIPGMVYATRAVAKNHPKAKAPQIVNGLLLVWVLWSLIAMMFLNGPGQ